MKILVLAQYIYLKDASEFERNKTGYGLMVASIAKSLAELDGNEVYIDTYCFSKGRNIATSGKQCAICKRSKFDFLLNIRFRDVFKAVKCFFSKHSNMQDRIHQTFYCLNGGYFRKRLKKLKPDIVHIQNIDYTFTDACEKLGVPHLVTLHGLNGFLPNVDIQTKVIEKKYICESCSRNKVISVISSGIKKRIEKEYLDGNIAHNIHVVNNGTNMIQQGLVEKERIVTIIGTIGDRKNQEQIIEALRLIKDEIKGYKFYFCGKDLLNGKLQELAKKYELTNSVVFTGFINFEQISDLLNRACLNIVASKDEGFGLSIIEAFAHGVPTVCFNDIDAFDDIYDQKAILVSSRSTQALSETIVVALRENWDHKYIQEHAKKFSLEAMQEKYNSLFKVVLLGYNEI